MRISGGSEIYRALRLHGSSRNLISESLNRISSGLRVRSAADDAAALGVSEKMRTRLGVYDMDIKNAQSGLSVAQTADGGLQNAHAILKRIRDITIWAANGTFNDADREHFQSEVDKLLDELDRINTATEYNGMSLYTGRMGAQAREYSDTTGALKDGSVRVLSREIGENGLYEVEVVQQATFAQASFEGRALDQGEASPRISDQGSFYSMIGANNNGYVDLSVNIGNKMASVTVYADSVSGDSILDVVRKFNDALGEADIDARAFYEPSETGSTIALDLTGVIAEPLETTVPVAWQNATPTSWFENGPKIYDPAGAYGNYTTFEINFTSSTNFNVTANDTWNLGSGSTGTNFNSSGISFKVQPDGDFAAGDQIILTPGPGYPRPATMGGSTTGLTSPGVTTDSTIADGAHTVTVTNTSSVNSWDFSQVMGTPIITGTDTSGVSGQGATVETVDSTWANGAESVDSWSAASTSSGTPVVWNSNPVIWTSGNTIVNETFTLQLITDLNGNDVWSVTGSVSGAHANMTSNSGHLVTDSGAGTGGGLFFNLAPNAAYVLGDTITIDTSTGPAPTVNVATNVEVANTLVAETFTLNLITDNGGPTDVWSVTGSVSGAHTDLTVGAAYTTNDVVGQGGGLTIGITADANYVVDDRITIDVSNYPVPVPSYSVGPDFAISGHTIVNETITMTLTADINGADTWSVTGSVSGNHSPASAGGTYISDEGGVSGGKGLRFNLDQDVGYGIGDVITFDTDVNTPVTSWAVNPTAVPITNTLLTETLTLELITDMGGANDVWSVTGSVSGTHSSYTVDGTTYTSDNGSIGGGSGLSFRLNSHANYALGDKITIDTLYGREAALDTDSTPTSVVPSSGPYTLTDDSGNTLRASFGNTITAGSDTVTLDTNISVNATVLPDITWSIDPHLLMTNTIKMSETFILTMTQDNDGADEWTVVGTESGTHQDYTSGTTYVSNIGSNGFGSGLEFELDPDSRYHIGSEIRLNVYVARPTIVIQSRKAGASFDLEATVNWDETTSSLDTHGTNELVVSAVHSEIGTGTVIYDNDGNPYNDLDLGAGTFIIQTKDGNTYTLTVNTGDTIQDLLDSLNALSPITAIFDNREKNIIISDSTSGNDTFTISDPDGSFLAVRLGINQEVAGDTLTGNRISRVRDLVLKIIDPDKNTAMIRASSGNRSTLFSAYRTTSTTESIAASSTLKSGTRSTGRGGITGVEFELEDKLIAAGTTFSIQLEKGTLVMQSAPDQGNDGRHQLTLGNISSVALGLREIGGTLDVSSQSAAQLWLANGKIDTAINQVSLYRGRLAAFQRSLEETLHVNRLQIENLQSAESRIRDADMADEMTRFGMASLLMQTGQAALAHLAMARTTVLDLLR